MTRNRKQTPLLADKSSSESDELLVTINMILLLPIYEFI